jgi:hypothetical protein
MKQYKLTLNYPEMWGDSDANIQAEYTGIGGKPYRVTSITPLPIKRGIEYNGTVGEYGSSMMPNKRAGWFKYYMTARAFYALKNQYDITLNSLLD